MGMGGKGGGAAASPVESPDSLKSTAYARVLLALSEGEIYGPATSGNILQSIYLDGTPIANDDGTLNFQGVTVVFRPGTQTQDPIPGFSESESTEGIGVELKSSLAYTKAITNTDLTALRISLAAEGLSRVDASTGNISGYRVEYKIELSTDGGAYSQVVSAAFDGKTTSRYVRSHRIELPTAATGWSVRVTRITANANSSTISDRTSIDSIVSIIDGKFRRPMTALLGLELDAAQFQSIPTVSIRARGKLIRIPSNYDPATRVYTGVWDGTFKTGYSNNPAWTFYDMVTNEVHGLGDRIPAAWLDKWALYQIAQYCDVMVPDGIGGMEPRYACNLYLQARAPAWQVIQDMASVFFGIAYYSAGMVVPVAEMPRDPVFTYSNSNISGMFNYVGTPRSTRYTVAQVSWNDNTNQGKAKVEVVEDREGILRYGIRQTETTAFACTSQGQAQRAGRMMLLSSQLETRAVNFTAGLDAAIVMPGQIIRVADNFLAGRRISGRILSSTSTTVALDSAVDVAPGDMLTITLPTGVTETREITSAAGVGTPLTADTTAYTADTTLITADATGLPGSTTVITVDAFSAIPVPESVWTIESYDLASQTFRVVSVREEEGLQFTISAVQHVRSKFGNVDFDTVIQTPPITSIPAVTQVAPGYVTISSFPVIRQGVSSITVSISWPQVPDSVYYDVQWRRDNSEWVTVPRTSSLSTDIESAYSGSYTARVRAVNALGVASGWTSSVLTVITGAIPNVPTVTFLKADGIVMGIELSWGYPVGPSIIERAEIWYSPTNVFGDGKLLGQFSYPQNTFTMTGLASGQQFYFWIRLVDKNGTQGAYIPSDAGPGKKGTASADAGAILAYLTEKISETQLAQHLLTKIESGGGAQVAIDTIISELAAMYTIKTQLTVDGHTYLAGIGVGVENDEGIVESQVLVAADRFAVINPDGSGGLVSPFVVDSGQVFINQAFIGDAWITNAMIGNTIQSNDFVSGSTGWQLNKSGSFQLNGPGGTGRLVITNNVIKVYDSSNVLRVQMGDLSA